MAIKKWIYRKSIQCDKEHIKLRSQSYLLNFIWNMCCPKPFLIED